LESLPSTSPSAVEEMLFVKGAAALRVVVMIVFCPSRTMICEHSKDN
jgi:hypothetical protein